MSEEGRGDSYIRNFFEYASTIVHDTRFDKTQVIWDFWLVGSETDDTLNEICNSSDRPPGCAHIFKTHNAQVWAERGGKYCTIV